MPASASPSGERIDESLDGVLRGEAQQVAHAVGIDDRIGRGQHLVEQRLGIAHAAGGEARDELQGVGVGDPSLRRRGCAPSLPWISSVDSGRKVNRWSRETTAGRIWLGSVVQKMNSTPSGGSSSVLSRTSQPSLMRWTSSMMNTLRRRSAAAV